MRPLDSTYRRIVVKVSGESLGCGDPAAVWEASKPLVDAYQRGVRLGLVVGGGNFVRGNQASMWGIPSERLDRAGMLATAFNASTLSDVLEASGVPTQIYSRGVASALGKPYNRQSVNDTLATGAVVIIAGGMGVPGISTDVASVHLAADTRADLLVMSKFGVDGVYDADPRDEPNARFLAEVTIADALRMGLSVMDREALELAQADNVAIRVVPADCPNALTELLDGESLGSLVHPGALTAASPSRHAATAR